MAKIKYTKEILQFLKEKRKKYSIAEIQPMLKEKFNLVVKETSIRNVCSKHKITGVNKGQYKKGHIPKNKGTKGFMKANSGSFKKGQKSITKKKIGTERIDKDGYILVKIKDPDVWKRKHRVMYEKYHNVKLKKGEHVLFLDQNKRNFSKENLIRVSQGEMAV